jgi:hypothetical protein
MERKLMCAVQQNLLSFVEEGMAVYDRQGKKIGKVGLAFPGANAMLSGEQAVKVTEVDETLLADEVRASLPPERVLPEVRQRLFQAGFLKINTGLLAPDRYALADQVETVTSDRVYLGVNKDETLKF